MLAQIFLMNVFLILNFSYILGNPTQDKIPDEINRCLSSDKHKLSPMANKNELSGECKPWTERSCCDNDRADAINSEDVFNLNKNLCANMTEECTKYFKRETCFFECSPNVGLWFEEFNSSGEYQRFRNVPLCQKDCDSWYKACAEDLTCTDNWYANKKTCDSSKKCTKIGKMFKTSKDFCETIWDNSYQVVDDKKCMTFSFNPKNNPNEEVAMEFYQQKNSAPTSNNYVLVIIMFLVPFLY